MTFTPWDMATILCALVAGVVIIVQYMKREALERELRAYKEKENS